MINSFVRTTCRHVHQIDYMHFDNKLNCSPKSAANKQKTTATTNENVMRVCYSHASIFCEFIHLMLDSAEKKKQLFFSPGLNCVNTLSIYQ